MAVFWVLAPYSMVEVLIALMMEAARISEKLVNFFQTTRRYNPEDSHFRTHRRENLKSCSTARTFFSFRILSVSFILPCKFLCSVFSFPSLSLTTLLFLRSNSRLFTECVSDPIRPCGRSLHFAPFSVVIRWLPPKSCSRRFLCSFLYFVDR
jgi:hypothetical protein